MAEGLFQYEYMRYAFACGAIIGVLCAIIGVYVILRGMSFLGVGISHSAIGGTAIGVAAGIPTELSAFVYCMLTVWIIGLLSSENRMKLDAAIGVLFAFSQALGIFIFSLTPTLRSDLNSYLFGSIVSVDLQQLVLSACALLLIGAVLICVYRPLNSMIFDAEFAQVCGVRVTLLHYLLLLLTAVCVVCSMQIVGVLLVSALIVIPASAARLLFRTMKSLLFSSALFGALSCILGLVISYYTDTAPGPVIVLFSGFIFLACWMLNRARQK